MTGCEEDDGTGAVAVTPVPVHPWNTGTLSGSRSQVAGGTAGPTHGSADVPLHDITHHQKNCSTFLVLNELVHSGIMGTGPDNKRGRGRLGITNLEKENLQICIQCCARCIGAALL